MDGGTLTEKPPPDAPRFYACVAGIAQTSTDIKLMFSDCVPANVDERGLNAQGDC